MSTITLNENPRWHTWTAMLDARCIVPADSVESTGTPADRFGETLVDEFADDLRRLADA